MGNIHHIQEISQTTAKDLQRQECSVKEFVQDVIALIEQPFLTQNIHIHQRLDYDGLIAIDRLQMRRVFLNIADNARKTMPDGGTFTIRSRQADGSIHFELSDDGSGVGTAVLESVFTPFGEQAEDCSGEMGLMIVKKILDGHGAHIDIQRVIDKGTTVHIVLPEIQ